MLRVGMGAPDFSATLLETSQEVRLSDYWRRGDLVVEFGSFT
jgi:peroxiredoxin